MNNCAVDCTSVTLIREGERTKDDWAIITRLRAGATERLHKP